MTQLSPADLTRVLDAVAVLNSGVDLASLPARSLECITTLIPNELTAFDGWDREGAYDGSLWYSPPGTVPLERVELFGELIKEHPNFLQMISAKDQEVARLSDSLSLDKFRKTVLFNEFFRLFDGDAQLRAAVRLAPNTVVTCSLHRKKKDFSDNEYELLRLVAPHIKAAFKNAQYVNQVDSERRYLDRAASKGVVALDETGKPNFQSLLAQQWMTEYFVKFDPFGIPSEIREYIDRAAMAAWGTDYYRPPEPLLIFKENAQLKITVTFDSREREVLVFLEEKRAHVPSDFQRAGTSRREAEILYWISQGKTDPQIAEILSISPRTVHKHIEHIFSKFGVETRTAAVMHVVDRL